MGAVVVGTVASVVDVVGTTVVVDDVVVLDDVVVGGSVVVVLVVVVSVVVVDDHTSKSITSSYVPSPHDGVLPTPNWAQQYPVRNRYSPALSVV